MEHNFSEILSTIKATYVLKSLLILIIGLILSKIMAKSISKYISKIVDNKMVFLSNKILFYFFSMIVLLTALSEMGIDLKILLSAAGILTVAIGFAAQTSMSNLISGIFLLFEKPFSIGDTVTIDDITGIVLSIDLMSTRLRTFDNMLVRIPNESIMKGKIQNLTFFDIRRADLIVSVAYHSDLEKVSEILKDLAANNELCLDEPPPLVIMLGFKESSIDMQFSVWTRKENFLTVRNKMYEDIKLAFDKEGIEIPFPQRVVWMAKNSSN